MTEDETRSGDSAATQLDWVGGVTREGVGARHAPLHGPQGGGGYLNECIGSEVPIGDWDALKIRELETMGLPQVWLDIARLTGYETFVEIWRRMDMATETGAFKRIDGGMIEMQLRGFKSFKRFQRNRFIESLAMSGMNVDQIRYEVLTKLGEKLTPDHTFRLTARVRFKR